MPLDDALGTADRQPPILAVERVVTGYGGAPVVRGVSVSVGRGEIVSVVGANGAGKSTLLKAIVGALHVSSGSVRLGDRDVTNAAADELIRHGLGYVPQQRDVFDTLTVAENLEMGGYLLPRKDVVQRVAFVMDVFPAIALLRRRKAGNLSGGERKMVAVARALMLHPVVLVLDEPTAGLTEELAKSVLEEHVVRLASSGCAVLLVEQRAAAALTISHWAYVLVAGQVGVEGPAHELLSAGNLGGAVLGQLAT